MSNITRGKINFVIWKPTDQYVNNAGLTDDTDFKVVCGFSPGWIKWRLYLLAYQADITCDWIFGWTYPATGLITWNLVANNTGAADGLLATSTPTVLNATAGITPIEFNGIFRTVSNGGTFQFRWGQNAPSATNSLIAKGSFMEYELMPS